MNELLKQQMRSIHKEDLVASIRQASEYSHQLDQQLREQGVGTTQTVKQFIETPTSLFIRKYDYMQRTEEVDHTARTVGLNEYRGGLTRANETATAGKELSKEQKKALEKEKAVMVHEAAMSSDRQQRIRENGKIVLSRKGLAEEKRLLVEKLDAIDQSLKAAMEDKSLTDERKLKLLIEAMKDRIDEYDTYAHLLPMGTKERLDALKTKESLGIELRDLKKDLEICTLDRTDSKEADRLRSSKKTHAFYDVFRSVVHSKHSLFHPDTSLSREDAEYYDEKNKKVFMNKGRAFFGGTKPMYFYKEAGEGGKDWLYKEAVDCLGNRTPERAYMTEAASRLQRFICGDEHSIPVFVARNKKGEAIGTFQEQVKTMKNPTVDLFKWQKKAIDSKDPDRILESAPVLEDYVTRQIMREHTLDWLLCNFDTKGENFLQKEDGSLVSIDKEASFSKINDSRAAKMDRKVVLHKNDTIYNVLFSEFVERKTILVPQHLDFDSVEEHIIKIENLTREQYLNMFDDYLTFKYGEKGTQQKPNEKRAQFEAKILERKENLREEYGKFFGSLLKERYKFIEDNNDAAHDFDEHYKMNEHYRITPTGDWIYVFPSKRVLDNQ